MKKNGFVSTSIIYTFFIVFLLLMLFLLNSYSRVRYLLEDIQYDIKNSFAEADSADINLYFMVWNSATMEYELKDEMPEFGYSFDSDFSYCKNGSSINYLNGNISIAAGRKDSCYAYFRNTVKDIDIKMYTKEDKDAERVLVRKVPNTSYKLTSSKCSNGAILNFDEETRTFTITSEYKTVCEAEFTRREMDVKIYLFVEDASGNHKFNGLRYTEVEQVPENYYIFDSYKCESDKTKIINNNGVLEIEASGKDTCNVYYTGGSDKVEIIIMEETEEGIEGYTAGKKYSRVYAIPASTHAFVGYICDDKDAVVRYQNGTLYGENDTQTTCRAYFNKYSENVLINYYLQTLDGKYESVSFVPILGYKYNKDKSKCQYNGEIIVENNIVNVSTTNDNEVCDVYFDMINTDIKVLVYVMNRNTGKYELGDIPIIGYEMYNPGCTNGASIEYINSTLEVTSEGPTVCTVYFR